MKLLLAGFISLLAASAMADPVNKPTNGTELRSAQAEVSKPDNVPVGGCMPIGLTATGQTPASLIPIGQAASDQIQTGQLQASEFLTGQTQKRAHKRLSRAERRAKQGLPPEPAPQVTGSIVRN